MTPEQEMRAKAIELAIQWKSTLAAAAIQAKMGMKDMNPFDDLDLLYEYISEGKNRRKNHDTLLRPDEMPELR